MRHKRVGRKLGVTTKHRKSMLRTMVTDLFRNDRLRTTDTRAKELRRVAEKLITLAKDGSLHKRRQAGAYIRDNEVLRKLFDEIAEKFKDRPGGYTRIIKLGFRKGDNSPISLIELVEEEYKPKKKKKAPKKAAPKPKAKKESAKSSKKESAEELGLIDDEAKAGAAAAAVEAEEPKVEETPEAKTEKAPEVKEEAQVEAPKEEKSDESKTPEASAEAAEEPEASKKEVAESDSEAEEKKKED